MILAILAAVLLVSAGIGGTIFFIKRDKPEQKDSSADEERKKLEDRIRQQDEKLRTIEEKAKEKEKQDQEHEKNRREFDKLMRQGKAALGKQHFQDAMTAYEDARRLFPDDPEARDGLISAQSSAGVDAKTEEEQKKRRLDYDRLMAEGEKAKENKDYPAAQKAFEAALIVLPGDPKAAVAVTAVKQLIEANEKEKDRQTKFQAQMNLGEAAMVRQDYEAALRAFLAAQQIMPDDLDAPKRRRAAENQLDNIQDRAKRLAIVQNLNTRGREAITAKRFDEAIDAYNSALKLSPEDFDAKKGLAEATKARTLAKAEYGQLIATGNAALQTQQFLVAQNAFQAAAAIFPNEPVAQNGILAARQGLAAATTTVPVEIVLALQRYLAAGQLALAERRYADATIAFNAALQISPTDPTALTGLLRIKELVDRKVLRKVEIDQLLVVGAQTLAAGRYFDAIKAYKDVLLLDGDNLRAIEGLREARYGKAMFDGRQALLAKRYPDAVRFFQDALLEKPGDFTALSMLKQAQFPPKK